jgi:aldehyde:ferredoxin oxidoreductase
MKTLFGWAGKILRVDVTDGGTSEMPTMNYAPRFIGGQGIASRMYWEQMSNSIGAFDPENHLFVMNGPLCGTGAPAASRWIIAGKSPIAFPEQYAYGNLGGNLGSALKWAGLDGLDIVGSSRKPVILVIGPGGTCSIEDGSGLWGKDTFETITALQKTFGSNACVATIGKAGEQLVRFANVIGSGGVSASKGFGAVMGSKNLKAVVVRAPKVVIPVARPDLLKKTNGEITSLWKGESSGRYWPQADIMLPNLTKVENSYCYGCPGTCGRGIYQTDKGERGHRISCASAFFYSGAEIMKTDQVGEAAFHATQLANKEGICTSELLFLTRWLPQALRTGVVDPVETALDPDELGTSKWIEALVNLIVHRKGIGGLLAEGSRRATRELNIENLIEGLVSQTGFSGGGHDPRLYPSLIPIYATEPSLSVAQIHEIIIPTMAWMKWMTSEGMRGFMTTKKLRNIAKTFWGDEKAAEFDSPDKMGEAAVRAQNRSYAKDTFVLCDWFWPIHFSGNTESGVGDPTLEAKLFTAVTGEDMDEDGFLRVGERCANLNRAIRLREGRRGRIDDILEEYFFTQPLRELELHYAMLNPENKWPGKEGSTFTSTDAVVRRDFFTKTMDDYYKARGWDPKTGLQKRDTLRKLNLGDIIELLEDKVV